MLKQIITVIIASVLAIVFMKEVTEFLGYVNQYFNMAVEKLDLIFAGGDIGHIIKNSVSLTLIPVVFGLVPAAVYWVFARKQMPIFSHIVWIIWIMLVTTLALHS